MKKFENYEETEVKTFGDFERIELGGHVCVITKASVTSSTKDGVTTEQLRMEFDFAADDKQAGYFSKRFKEDAEKDALKAKWRGYYNQMLPRDDGSEKDNTTKGIVKGMFLAIETCNPGYKWNWEESTLVGKKFGGVFGLEEFENADGKVLATTRCKYMRAIEKIEEAKIPKVKLLDKSSMEYEDYIEMKKNEKSGNGNTGSGTSTNGNFSAVVHDENLPF